MKENDLKRKMVEKLIKSFSVRNSEVESSRANLEKLSIDELQNWMARLEISDTDMKDIAPHDKGGEEIAERRRLAQEKIATGLTQLAAVSRKIAKVARQPEKAEQSFAESAPSSDVDLEKQEQLVVTLAPHPQDNTVIDKFSSKIQSQNDPFMQSVSGEDAEKYADNLWLYPLIVNKSAESTLKTLDPSVASRTITLKQSRTYSEVKILPVDNAMLGVDQLQSLVLSNLVRLLDGNNIGLQYQDRLAELKSQLTHDPAFTKYFQIQIASMVRDIFQMVTENYAIREQFSRISPFMDELQRQARAPSPAVEMTFIPDKSPEISDILLIDGMAKMIARTREYDPDCVVVIGNGGQILGKLVQNNFKNSAKFIFVEPGTNVGLQRGIPRNCSRILVLDDIARTGETMRDEISRCRHLHTRAAVRGMALVGTTRSCETLGDEVFFPNLSAAPEPQVPWDRRGQYGATAQNYILGRGGETQFSFSKTLLGRAVLRMMPVSIA
ncbi:MULTISPECIES: hypothetical protein [Methylobacterium]|jgi:hypothetical protein|uniref:phosphoribosyltransferase n=1 Tax=Methylobacterium TaxID=407 RepID=UPI0008EA8008|nr:MULTISPECIES: hypothetical protein [Methylobacterium]MBK3397454.1 hypothetical protein [Methylobacterium ajmalii]MBK3422038.1 hypothetical protein [Methylobacterium ajmalii]MBZ6411161.1 hypothetical protein [Methylobacterium sp.]SFE18588.1 hypothetical protein SAMN04487844_101348 [Methylobacterium sp. yr596]